MLGARKVAALVAEFVGTFLLTSVVLGMIAKQQPFYATVLMAGITLALVVLGVGRASGAHINPAVTVGLWTIRKVETTRAIAYIAVQLLAGYSALLIAREVFGNALIARGGESVDWKIVTAEALGAALFTMGIAAAVYRGYRGVQAAVTIGASLTLGLVVAALGSGAVLNPAVALGINSFTLSYVMGPVLGAVFGMNLYAAIFAPLDIAERQHALGLLNHAPAAAPHAHAPAKKVAEHATNKPVAKKLSSKKAIKR